jgi:hypothetical protein
VRDYKRNGSKEVMKEKGAVRSNTIRKSSGHKRKGSKEVLSEKEDRRS